MSMKKRPADPKQYLFAGIAFLVMSLSLCIIALVYARIPQTPVKCGRAIMRANNTCEHRGSSSGGGPVAYYTYAQQKQYNAQGPITDIWVSGIAGGIALLIGISYLLLFNAERSSSKGAQASTGRSSSKNARTSGSSTRSTQEKSADSAARKQFERDARHFASLCAQATQAKQRRKYQQALAYYKEASRYGRFSARMYADRAQVLSELNREQEAWRDIEQALALTTLPKDKQICIDAYTLKALLLEKAGRYNEALEALNSILTLDLEHLPTLEARARILAKQQSS